MCIVISKVNHRSVNVNMKFRIVNSDMWNFKLYIKFQTCKIEIQFLNSELNSKLVVNKLIKT